MPTHELQHVSAGPQPIFGLAGHVRIGCSPDGTCGASPAREGGYEKQPRQSSDEGTIGINTACFSIVCKLTSRSKKDKKWTTKFCLLSVKSLSNGGFG